MKRLLTVQDISCVGKCSATVALPIISAMGVEAAILPTAVLSTHTAFPEPAVQDLTGGIGHILAHWQRVGVAFDGIYTGYLGSVDQVSQMLTLVEKFRRPGSLLLVDPVMGDNGRLYSRVDQSFAREMGRLCAQADVLLPNLTEACLLTDTPYLEHYDEAWVKGLLQKLSALGCGIAMLTGISLAPEQTGVMGYEKATGEFFSYFHEKLPQSYHGTGDIFASTCAGALLLGKDWKAAVQIAAAYTSRCIRLTMDASRGREYGVNFEQAIPYLLEIMK